MILQAERWKEWVLERPPTKPGQRPKRSMVVEDPHTCDSPENIATCLNCPFPTCIQKFQSCPLNKTGKKLFEVDNKILDLINAGRVNRDAICEELGISKTVYYAARRRLRERGEIS